MTDQTTTTVVAHPALRAAGAVAGPLFAAVVVIQMLTRDGFDPEIHALSQLSTGDLGWLQITNFILCGLLFLAGAVGLRQALRTGRGRTWGPLLIGLFGVSLVWAGVFVADPAEGFPPGTPEGPPEELSWHGILHAVAPAAGAVALVAVAIIVALRFGATGARGWRGYTVASVALYLVLSVVGLGSGDFRIMFVGGVLGWVWASLASARLMSPAPGPSR